MGEGVAVERSEALPVAEGEDPWTDEETAEVREELESEVARLERAIRTAEAGLADLFKESDGAGCGAPARKGRRRGLLRPRP